MSCLLLRNVRPLGAAAVDVRVEDGVIAEIGTDVAAGPLAIDKSENQLRLRREWGRAGSVSP